MAKQSTEEKNGRRIAKIMVKALTKKKPGFYEDIANYGITTALYNAGWVAGQEAQS